MSLTFSVASDGTNPKVANVIFKNLESAVAIAKHTNRAPVTPITGTFECTTCNGHPNLNTGATQTFNLMFTTPEGNSTITTQSAIGTAVFNGIGVQDNCTVSGTLATCDLTSGDGRTNVGFMTGGSPVTWTGKHSFNNETTGPQDCSGAFGDWTWITPSYGTITGTFISDVNCFTTLYSEDFQTFNESGFTPTPVAGQLDSDIIIATGFSDGSLAYGGTETTGDFGTLSLLYASALFFFKIYCDFSGYSDIAIGTAKLFGFKLSKNFSVPYFSRSVSEFWLRWHITLTKWFTDYVYAPMVKNSNRGYLVKTVAFL